MLTALLLLAQIVATTPDPWSLMAQRDVQAMHDAILANHPGPVDAQNPAFRDWLERGLTLSLAKAAAAKTFGGYVYALRFYGAGFRDGHLNSGVLVTWPQTAWPGF